jgi:glycine/D-amino acid oxidase-like deaminating enzyme/nitrite reductase/ring-hydroxylating ferredoxin subunit
MQELIEQNSMGNNQGQTQSVWMEVRLPLFSSLNSNINADVCIVGAGIVGLTCAYTLAKQGKNIVVLDQGLIGGEQTMRTTAHITWALDDRYYDLESFFGEEGSRTAAESHAAAIDYIEKIVREEKIDCDFERVNGYLFTAPECSKAVLEKEYIAIKKTGMEVSQVKNAPFSSFDTGPCLHFPKQAQFHIAKYLDGLVRAIVKYGGKIFTNSQVNHFVDGDTCLVRTQAGQEVTSRSVIVATSTPINNRFIIHTKQAAFRTYVIAAPIPKGSVPKGLYWDTADPYHYIRTQNHTSDSSLEWLIIGGEDHKTGQDDKIAAKYDDLEKWARKRFPMITSIDYRWSGQVFEPIDSLAFIGRNPRDKNIYIATGDSGNGITHGTIAGILLPDLILGKANSWQALYEPSRKTWAAAPQFLKESFNIAVQYRDWFTPGERKKIESLAATEGIILRKGLNKVAVYKDNQNNVHVQSAFCPHLGGCVRWNPGEKSWDCPCHGSRFDGCGKVINGPAIDNLPTIK